MMMYKQIILFIKKYSFISQLSKRELFIFGFIVFVLKLLMVLLINFLDWSEGVSFYTNAGDDGQYIGYSENLYQTGEYFFDFGNSGTKDYFFRMPGITFLYYPIRFLFNQQVTINLIVVIQVLLSTIATFKFLQLINKYFKINNLLFLCLSVFYFYTAYLDASLMTESLGLSSLLFSIYYLDKGISEYSKSNFKNLLTSGFFITWLVFLRPFMVPFLILFSGYIFFKSRKLKLILAFILPFLVIDGLWLFRNVYFHNEFVVLQKSYNWQNNGSKSLSSKFKFIQSFGLKIVNFEEGNHAAWFNNQFEAPSVKIPSNDIFPSRIFVGEMTIDSLILARKLMHQVVDKKLDPKIRIESDKESARILNKFVSTLKSENPFDYYFFNRVRLLMSFLEPNTHKLFLHGPYPYNIIVSYMHILFSVIVKYGGLLGLVYLFFRKLKDVHLIVLFSSTPIFLFILFPFVLQLDETRFFYLSYPILIMLLLNLLNIFSFKK